MFTGIVEEIGTVRAVRRGAHSSVLSIGAVRIQNGLKIGDSVAVNGVCLTVCSKDSGGFTADVMHETLNRSSLGCLSVGSRVNLERAMAADGRFGGHIVSGHIDGVGCIRALQRDDNALWYTVEAAPQVLRYIVEKGSIAMDGISLTVVAVTDTGFTVSIIPHTQDETTLVKKKIGDVVNLENDVIAKYVEKLMRPAAPVEPKGGLTLDFLLANGF